MLEDKQSDSARNMQQRVVPTGIAGLDTILGGGLPRNKVMLLVGGPGCGKSVFSMEFILNGSKKYGESGLYCSFEETRGDLIANAASFGHDLEQLVADKKLSLASFDLQSDQKVELGEFNLEALFMRIELGLQSVAAQRLVLDGISNLFAGFSNEKIIRSEIIRLFRWLKAKDLTVIVTGEKGTNSWSRFGFEEYLCDGLVFLSNEVEESFTTRHLRVIKCRGVEHATDKYPFLISRQGIEIIPSLSSDFEYTTVRGEFVSSGVPDLDVMLENHGFVKGSTVLITGTSGAGKSSLSAAFVHAACQRGERAIYFAFEESSEQVMCNMLSIGLDLRPAVESGLLKLQASRSTVAGLEGHLVKLKNTIEKFQPSVVVVDPITAFRPVASVNKIKLMLIRLNDFLRSRRITSVMTSLSAGFGNNDELSDVPMSSLADTWVSVRILEAGNEKNNILELHKARGMAHDKQRKELVFTREGIVLDDLYMGPEGLLAGAAKVAQQVKDVEADKLLEGEIGELKRQLKVRQALGEQRLTSLKEEVRNESLELQGKISGLSKKLKYREVLAEKIEEALAPSVNED